MPSFPSEAHGCRSVSLHPAGQLYVNVHERPGLRGSHWDCQADAEQGPPSQWEGEGVNLAD